MTGSVVQGDGPLAGRPLTAAMSAAIDPKATLQQFTLEDLAAFTREGSFDPEDAAEYRTLYVGRDRVHEALKYVLARCSRSLRLNMFGYDDDELNAIIEALVADPHIYVQGTLDKSQSGGVHERKILEGWSPAMRTSFAIGQSATHQISHTKGGVIDNVVAWEGSTNWSSSGEGVGRKAQNNTCLFHVNVVELAKFTDELDHEHAVAVAQQTHEHTAVETGGPLAR